MLPVAVLAGGLGTRIRSLTGGSLPKALLDVAGRPFLDHKFEQLAAHGVDQVMLLVGHGAEALLRHIKDGKNYGISVEHMADGTRLLGTGGALRNALSRLPDAFWVTYGDTLVEAPMSDIESEFLRSDWLGLMTVFRNLDRWERSNVSIRGSTVVAYDKQAPPGSHEYVDYGLLLLRASAFDRFPRGTAFDLGVVLRQLVTDRRLGAYEVHTRFRSIGTPEALAETAEAIRNHAGEDRSRM